jgi:hypothetical protein
VSHSSKLHFKVKLSNIIISSIIIISFPFLLLTYMYLPLLFHLISFPFSTTLHYTTLHYTTLRYTTLIGNLCDATSKCHYQLGKLYLYTSHIDGSKKHFLLCKKISTELNGSMSMDVAISNFFLGTLY